MSTNPFDEIRAAVAGAEDDCLREYREMGTSLKVANDERKRLDEYAKAAIDLLIVRYGDRLTAEMAVEDLIQKRRKATP